MSFEAKRMPDDEQCPQCDSRCIHGYCECCEETCPQCLRRQILEEEAEEEAAWQRDVIGPMFGF